MTEITWKYEPEDDFNQSDAAYSLMRDGEFTGYSIQHARYAGRQPFILNLYNTDPDPDAFWVRTIARFRSLKEAKEAALKLMNSPA